MELKDILAISGQPGLFKYVARSSNGVIVESLVDGKRMNASGTAKISALAEISIYTDSEDMPLWKVFESFFAHMNGKPTVSHKSDNNQLKKVFADVIPDYDQDRVHVSDMKKVISWYNILVEAGMTDFKIEEEAGEQEEEKSADNSEKETATKNESADKAVKKTPAKKPAEKKAPAKKTVKKETE